MRVPSLDSLVQYTSFRDDKITSDGQEYFSLDRYTARVLSCSRSVNSKVLPLRFTDINLKAPRVLPCHLPIWSKVVPLRFTDLGPKIEDNYLPTPLISNSQTAENSLLKPLHALPRLPLGLNQLDTRRNLVKILKFWEKYLAPLNPSIAGPNRA